MTTSTTIHLLQQALQGRPLEPAQQALLSRHLIQSRRQLQPVAVPASPKPQTVAQEALAATVGRAEKADQRLKASPQTMSETVRTSLFRALAKSHR